MLVFTIDQVGSKWQKLNYVEKTNTPTAICEPRPLILIALARAQKRIQSPVGAPVVPYWLRKPAFQSLFLQMIVTVMSY